MTVGSTGSAWRRGERNKPAEDGRHHHQEGMREGGRVGGREGGRAGGGKKKTKKEIFTPREDELKWGLLLLLLLLRQQTSGLVPPLRDNSRRNRGDDGVFLLNYRNQ